MDIKKVMATFILTGLLFTGSNYYHVQQVNEKEEEIEELKEAQGLKDSEIARLENVVKSQENDIKEADSKLNENLEKTNKQEKIIETQKKLIDEQKRLMEIQKSELKTLREAKGHVNFNKWEKGVDASGRKVNVEMTAYVANCSEGCTGITATGIDIRNRTTYQGHRIVATDPNVIPLYSIMRVEVNGQSFTAISLDTGGAINGYIVDYLVGSKSEARKFGRQQGTVTILREGK